MMTTVMEVINRYCPKGFAPQAGIILGSGLNELAEQMTGVVSIPYQAIPGLQASTVAGHSSLLVLGYLNSIPIICLRGRVHAYEGKAHDSMRILIRIVKQMGAGTLLITCAAGSLQEEMPPGSLMMVNDHINFQSGNLLVGYNDESIGSRFVDMTHAYDLGFQDDIRLTAQRLAIPLHQGIYLSTMGPMFETPAEIRVFRQWGASAVGMSLVPEVIFARYCGLRVAAIAAITNFAAGMNREELSHEKTLELGLVTGHKLVKLVPACLQEMSHDLA